MNTLQILDQSHIEAAESYSDPFEFRIIREPIKPEFRNKLIDRFPMSGFEEEQLEVGAERFHMHLRSLERAIALDPTHAESIDPVWDLLYQDICSDVYRYAMETIINEDLSGCNIQANLWRYDEDCFLSQHTDKIEKVATHLLYLNPTWQEAWGGCLHLHGETDDRPTLRTIVPVIDNSVVLITSDKSWHSVAPVVEHGHHRKSLQIVFWRSSELRRQAALR